MYVFSGLDSNQTNFRFIFEFSFLSILTRNKLQHGTVSGVFFGRRSYRI